MTSDPAAFKDAFNSAYKSNNVVERPPATTNALAKDVVKEQIV